MLELLEAARNSLASADRQHREYAAILADRTLAVIDAEQAVEQVRAERKRLERVIAVLQGTEIIEPAAPQAPQRQSGHQALPVQSDVALPPNAAVEPPRARLPRKPQVQCPGCGGLDTLYRSEAVINGITRPILVCSGCKNEKVIG